MAQEFSQTQKLEQGLSLTPQLKRSLEILQAPSVELEALVSSELRVNPLLEQVEGADKNLCPLDPPKPPKYRAFEGDFDASSREENSDFPRPADGGEILPRGSAENYLRNPEYDSDPAGNSDSMNLRRDYFFNSVEQKESLTESLLKNAALDAPKESVYKAFERLLALMDTRGFVPRTSVEILVSKGVSEADAQCAVELLRGMSPYGIGAVDMRDSLMLQLEHKGRKDSTEYAILSRHYDLLLRRRVSEIASLMRISVSEVERAISNLAGLKTSPAAEFETSAAQYVCVDLVAKKSADGLWYAELTNERVPELRINTEYRNMLALGKLGKEAKSYVNEKTRDGKFIIEAIAHRQSTLKRIGDCICRDQKEFFDGGGFASLKPRTMVSVAEFLELHPTTISRAVGGKYMQTPFGVLPLKKFFTASVPSADGAGDVSNAAVKTLIAEMISGESSAKPLSDSQIAERLGSLHNMSVARRTVAKYRDALGIPPKSMRRRY